MKTSFEGEVSGGRTMRGMGRFEITGQTRHYWEKKAEYPERWEITEDICQWVVDNRMNGEFEKRESNGYWRFVVYVPELGYRVRVILLEDEHTLHTAFNHDKPIS